MRKTKSGTRNKQDWSAQDYGNQRLPTLALLSGNVRTCKALITLRGHAMPDSVRRKIDIAASALDGLQKLVEEIAKVEKLPNKSAI